jgi:hypothetical protein
VCRNASSVSHLFFVDDSLILSKANKVNTTTLRQVLNQYCANLGQIVSQAKCSIYFSPNVDTQDKADICTDLNIMTKVLLDKYLGLPSMVGLEKSEDFIYLLQRVIARHNGGKGKILSMGAKEILLKALIQSITVFAMVVLEIPKKIRKELTDAMLDFWWELMTQKYRGSQQSLREVKPKFIDSTQREPKNIYKP